VKRRHEGALNSGEYDSSEDDWYKEKGKEEEMERSGEEAMPCGGLRLAQSRGLCKKHGGDTRKPCLVEGCGTLANSRGLCFKHGGSKHR
jgi:hypothetical protein